MISEREFHARAVVDTTIPVLMATALYFASLSGYICMQYGALAYSGPLLAQKLVCLTLALGLVAFVRVRTLTSGQVYLLLFAILLICLSSMIASLRLGMRDNFPYSLCIPILAIGSCSLHGPWSALSSACIWSVWLADSWPFDHPAERSGQLVFLLGAQTIAVALQYNRWRTSRRFYEAYQRLWQQSRQLEGALLDAEGSRQKLDDLVAQRTRQLQLAYDELSLSLRQREEMQKASEALEAKLLQSQKMESLGRLAGGVAHDFNNLLTVISGNLELAQSLESTAEDNRDLMQQAQIAARRAADLTGQLLAFSRRQVLTMKPLDLIQVTQDSLRLLERLLGEDVQVDVRHPVGPLQIRGDAGQLHQVLMNLLVNARDAMPTGGRLQVELEATRQQGTDWVVLRVIDSGQGISKENLPRVFEPFFTTKPFGKGTGLGLSTVHGIVKQHQGEIQVDSQPGQGTTVTVWLPLTHETAADSGSRQLRPGPGNRRHILLVEDDAQVRGLACKILRNAGYQVTSATDGEDALQKVHQGLGSFDLLLTDVVMPQMDGATLAQELSRVQTDFKVLFVSGYTDDRLAAFGVESANLNFLGKPYSPIALCKKVHEVLEEVESPPLCFAQVRACGV